MPRAPRGAFLKEASMSDIGIRAVHKSYGKTAVVHGVDLDIRSGEFVVILGPSGCGKSTLLRMIAGLEEISAGDILIGGTRVNDVEPRHRGCAMVFQNYALYPHFSVAENIGYALKVAGVPKAERMRRIEDTARVVGLSDFLTRRPGELSGGQRQRVAMARAMIREPKVFLFDEPLSNLDARLRVQMRLEIRRLHARLGTTSVFVTHDQVEAMTLADRLVVMRAGHIEQVGTPEAVYARPATLFVAGFLGAPPMNLLPGRVRAPGQVEVGEGRVLRFAATAFDARVGQEVEVGIRAEEVVPDTAGLPLLVELTEELGAGRHVHATLDGMAFVVALPAGERLPAGRVLNVAVPESAVHLFDPVAGKRLAPPQGVLVSA
jgi:sn-glycerol 3-phosphate transport system ATP-binding protein